MITFVIPGKIQPKQRPRSGKNGFYTPDATKNYEKSIAFYAKVAMSKRKALITEEPIIITIDFNFKSPKKAIKSIDKPIPATNAKDLDNCVKSILDGLNGIIYVDDRQVVQIICRKIYTFDDVEYAIVNCQLF